MRIGFLEEATEKCAYLPNRTARNEHYFVGALSLAELDRLFESGYRLFGSYLFRPNCLGCHSCIPIRVKTKEFKPSKSQRRLLRKSEELEWVVQRPKFTAQKFELYLEHSQRFCVPDQALDRDDFETVYYEEARNTFEFLFYGEGGLLGVGYVMEGEKSTSSTYFYFGNKGASFRLGTFSLIKEIEWSRKRGKVFHYMGYLVPGNSHMEYKAFFRPNEISLFSGLWKKYRDFDPKKENLEAIHLGFQSRKGSKDVLLS